MKFLETITFMGNDALVPIDSIKVITYRVNENGSYEIIITGKGKFEWVECFDKDKKKADARYKMIKEIIEAK